MYSPRIIDILSIQYHTVVGNGLMSNMWQVIMMIMIYIMIYANGSLYALLCMQPFKKISRVEYCELLIGTLEISN